MAIIVHGATGAQGAPLLARLLRSGKQAVAAVRNISSVKQTEAVALDNASVDSLVEAYRGAEGVFIHLPLASEKERLNYAHNIAKAISIAQPERVVISTSGGVIDEPDTLLQLPEESAVATLVREVKASQVSMAVIATRLYLENLLLPVIWEPLKTEKILRYPLREDYPVSWCSHLDVANVAERLLFDNTIEGIVGVGQIPGLTGPQLAEKFADYFGCPIKFESLKPSEFGHLIAPIIGENAAIGVRTLYEILAQEKANVIHKKTSAQQTLGINPRTVQQWLGEIGM
ncbi:MULTISPECIES: SDR family oxidoreductase [unclassified Neisseria]|uniref:SDR family oxidoreductase n=1 Tax=unclassified Neisseria TaxID=2623750 RepID=UPI0026664FD9|nr:MULTISPECIES: NAD(P)H-binding protein [unclassified Neisseria]MDO1509651.1 NAD(P)H-binding protein [Neisseria sp. MVDL19-042950]MDO1516025.1 NAD(P)H-binding protein [Neisseria sp. MVDL18-041461]MDO1563139.1 NAD(P)H-binding protein [Neisseria sp. MVDL20-010259]